MRCKKAISIVAFLCLYFIFSISVSASSAEFVFEEIPEEDTVRIINLLDISMLDTEPPIKPFNHFDVSDDEMVVLCRDSIGSNKEIVVYDTNMIFQYGYTFKDEGSIAAFWNGQDLNVYLIRGSFLFSVTPDGEITGVVKIPYTENNNMMSNILINRRTCKVNDKKYTAKNDMGVLNLFAFSYSQISVTDEDGNTEILYDASSNQKAKYIAFIIIAFSSVVLTLLILRNQKNSKS